MQNKSLFYGGCDRLLFTTRVGDIGAREVVTVREDMTIQEAAQLMAMKKISSLIIKDKNNLPVGIVTDRDLREKVVAKARNVNEPIRNIMSLPLVRVDARDYCFEAVLKMIRHNIHHILVIKDGGLEGVITNHDLMLLQGTSPLSFAKDIESHQTIDRLIPVSGKTNKIIGVLLKEGAKASNPQWCQPLNIWKKYFHSWINTPTPEAVLKSLIFFDFRPLFGEFRLAAELRSYLIKVIKGQNLFLAQMAGVITKNRPPLGFLRTFIVDKSGEHKDELNLKVRGIGPSQADSWESLFR